MSQSPPSTPEPSTQYNEWLERLNPPDVDIPREIKLAHIAQMTAEQSREIGLEQGVETEEFDVPVATQPNGEVRPVDDSWAVIKARVYTPVSYVNNHGENISVNVGPFPLVVYIPGGEFIRGGLDGEDVTCRGICKYTRCVVVAVDYRRPPEFKYPTPLHDCWDVLKWALSNGPRRLLASPVDRGFMLAGTASGASMALSLALRARQAGLTSLTGLILRAPWTIHPETAKKLSIPLPSFTNDLIPEPKSYYPVEVVHQGYAAYAPPEEDWSSAYVSPLLGNFKLLPRTYVQLCELDVSFSEGMEFVERAKKQGAEVRCDVFKGLPHRFWDLPRIEGACDAMGRLVAAGWWMEEQGSGWDAGLRVESGVEWGLSTEGKEAWAQRKLCRMPKDVCGCWM